LSLLKRRQSERRILRGTRERSFPRHIQTYVAMKAREIVIVVPMGLLNQDANSLFDVPVKNTQDVDPASNAVLGAIQIIGGILGEENGDTGERPDLSFDGPIERDNELLPKVKKTDAEKAKQREERMFKDEEVKKQIRERKEKEKEEKKKKAEEKKKKEEEE
jgi:hypothetical protein